MAEPTVWERREIQGTLKSAERKTNHNNREFMAIVIDDQEYSAWEDNVMALVECAIGGVVKAKVRRKEGSRYWNLDDIDVISMPDTTPEVAAGVQVEALASSPDPSVAVRIKCLELAVASYVGADDRTNANVIVQFAIGLESYVLGVTPIRGN